MTRIMNWGQRALVRCVLGLIVIALVGVEAVVEADVDWPRLFQGEVLVTDRRNDAGVRGAKRRARRMGEALRTWIETARGKE